MFYCINHQTVTIENYPMRIWQWLFRNGDSNNTSMIWVMDKITMTLLTNNNARGRIVFAESRGATSVRVFHDEPHALFVPDISHPSYAYHCDLTGEIFAGSNTFSDGKLCLGESFAPYNFAGIHLLCNYDANADLQWVGQTVQIEQPMVNNFRKVTRWPRYRTRLNLQIPQQIRDFFNH